MVETTAHRNKGGDLMSQNPTQDSEYRIHTVGVRKIAGPNGIPKETVSLVVVEDVRTGLYHDRWGSYRLRSDCAHPFEGDVGLEIARLKSIRARWNFRPRSWDWSKAQTISPPPQLKQ